MTQNLILYGAFSVVGGGTTLHGDAAQQEELRNATFSWFMLGGGVAYYLEPMNLFFSGTFGLSGFTVDDQYNSNVVDTDAGFGIDLLVGKEWWVSSSWGLGLAAQFIYGTAKDREPAVGRWNTLGGGLLFSATYN